MILIPEILIFLYPIKLKIVLIFKYYNKILVGYASSTKKIIFNFWKNYFIKYGWFSCSKSVFTNVKKTKIYFKMHVL